MQKSDLPIRVLLIDDEIEACDNIKNLLSAYTDQNINIVGIANDTAAADELVKNLKPDAVFLDIEMPGENAFQFLSRIYPYNFEIIFVTAYDEFALRAFKLNAVDYIQKPICIEELTDAIHKLRERINYNLIFKNNNQEIEVLKQIASKEVPKKITLKSLNHIEVLDFRDIYSIEGLGNYCKISFRKAGTTRDITTSNIIAHYEELLPAGMFFRVHKSYLVNCMYIEDILLNDSYSIVIKNKEKIPVSRRRYGEFIKFLKENNFYSA